MSAQHSLAMFLLGKVSKFKAPAHARSPPFPDFSRTSLGSKATGSVLSVLGVSPVVRRPYTGKRTPLQLLGLELGTHVSLARQAWPSLILSLRRGALLHSLFSLLEKDPNETYCDPCLATVCACFIDWNRQGESWVLGSGLWPCPSSPYSQQALGLMPSPAGFSCVRISQDPWRAVGRTE